MISTPSLAGCGTRGTIPLAWSSAVTVSNKAMMGTDIAQGLTERAVLEDEGSDSAEKLFLEEVLVPFVL